MENKRRRRILWLTILGVLLVHGLAIVLTYDGMSYVKDEGYYFTASRANFGWYEELVSQTLKGDPLAAFSKASIDRHWAPNAEHPPFCKTIEGLSRLIFHDTLNLLNFGASHRFATWLFTAPMLVALMLLISEWAGLAVAVGTVLLLFTMPNVFYHFHLSTFDAPVTAMWIITVFAFRKGLDSPRWAWATGVLLGVGLATKNNAYFLPFLFAILYLYTDYGRRLWRSLLGLPAFLRGLHWRHWLYLAIALLLPVLGAALGWREWLWSALVLDLLLINGYLAYHLLRRTVTIPKHIAPILPAIFTAPFVFGLLWPWIWYDHWTRLHDYLMRHLHPPAWETYYLHKVLTDPPPWDWHYPFVMSAFTLPITVLVLGLLGLVLLFAKGRTGAILHELLAKARGRLPQTPAPLLANARPADSVVTPEFDLWLIFWNILLPFLIIANPQTPKYGGTKHYMAAMPFIALSTMLLLRWTIDTLWPRLKERACTRGAVILLGAGLAALPGVFGIVHVHPHCLSYYNELMGGSIAAPEVGVQRMFWASATESTLNYVNAVVPKNGAVFFNNTPWDSIDAYKRDGYLRADIRQTWNPQEADYAVMSHWRYYSDGIYQVREQFRSRYAEYATTIDGLPLVEVFKNEFRARQLAEAKAQSPAELVPEKYRALIQSAKQRAQNPYE